MKKRQKITVDELSKSGWMLICFFMHFDVYGKGAERMLYDPVEKIIVFEYLSKWKKKRYTLERCPICNREYSVNNPRTEHHILPKRFFGKTSDVYHLCRKCHDKLEMFIPFEPMLEPYEYWQLLTDFIRLHSCSRKRQKHSL